MRRNGLWIWLLAAAGGAVAAVMALTSGLGGDYPGPACHGCDYAGPPIDALVHGNIHRFFAVQPVMGSFSLLVRWPAALVAQLAAHGDVLWQYRLGAFVSLLGPLALGVALARRMESRGASRLAQAVTVGICTASPLAFAALHWGHPEEPLAASLCVGAVLLAGEGRARTAGLLLGLAFATKPWAWLAIGPLVLAAPRERRAMLAVAVGAGGLLTLPMLLGDPGRFIGEARSFGMASGGVTPFNVWWGYAHQSGSLASGGSATAAYSIPKSLAALAHPLVIAVAVGLSVAAHRRHRPPQPVLALRLLALLFLARCLLDPLTYSYHHVPFLLALVAAEAVAQPRIPRVALGVTAISLLMSKLVIPAGGPDLASRVYLCWAVPIALYLADSLLRRGTELRIFMRGAKAPLVLDRAAG